ncbi:MAG: FHA domain-containing protein [Anaerolineaceae bacterium]|nr:FHA domain-containing protein [Anaerolineaceae bacterium]
MSATEFTIHLSKENELMNTIIDPQIKLLGDNLQEIAFDAGIGFTAKPIIKIVEAEHLIGKEIYISSAQDEQPIERTSVLQVSNSSSEHDHTNPEKAFLIVESSRHFPINMPVINIGRRLDNHLVIDDPKISRVHAQIRTKGNQFVLIDLNATGGTYINGKPITQQSLNPGDVISLAGFPLVFVIDNENENDNDKTNPTKIIDNQSESKPKAAKE